MRINIPYEYAKDMKYGQIYYLCSKHDLSRVSYGMPTLGTEIPRSSSADLHIVHRYQPFPHYDRNSDFSIIVPIVAHLAPLIRLLEI